MAALGFAASILAVAPAQAQVRTLHTRDLIRLSQVQVMDYLKRSDVVFIPVGAVETNGIFPSGRDYVTPLAYAMAMADEIDALYMPGLMWSYPGTTLVAPSTINITPSQGVAFLKAVSESLIRSGFRRLVFLSGGHGPAPLTVGTVVREIFDEFRVPVMYIEMGGQVAKLNLPAPQRNRLMYGAHQITGRLIDLPIKGDYGENPMGATGPIPENPGYNALNQMGFGGSLALGSWVTDLRSHGGGNQALPASAAERAEWGKQGEAQIRAIVKQLKLAEAMDNLRKHDEFTNKVLVPKFDKILPPSPLP